MKKLLLSLVVAFLAFSSQAAIITFEDGNFKYSLNTSNYWVSVVGLSDAGANLRTLRIPSLATYNDEKYYVKEIGSNAFLNNTQITSVYLETGAEKVSTAAFKGCTALTAISLSAVNAIASDAFEGCTALSFIYLASYFPPNYNPTASTNTSGIIVYVPCFKGILPRYKATYWNKFSTIKTEKSNCFPIRDFGGGSYGECVYSALPSGKATGTPEVEMIITDIDPDKEGSIKISSKLISENVMYVPRVIADSAFVGRTKLEGVSFGSVRTIGKAAFMGCSNMTSVTISCDTIGERAFEDCASLATITLNEGVKRVESRAFAGTAITSLTLPASLKAYNYVVNACDDCPNFVEYNVASASEDFSANGGLLFNKDQTALIRVPVAKEPGEWGSVIPVTCNTIRSGACGNNISRTTWSISIPYGITTIGGYAYENLKGVGTIVIPSSVTRIDQYAFNNSSIGRVIVGSSTPLSLSTDVFNGTSKQTLNVPVNAWEKYVQAPYWKNFSSIKSGGYDLTQFVNGVYGSYVVTKAATASDHGEVMMVYDTFYTNKAKTIPTSITEKGRTYDVVSLGDSVFVGNSTVTSLNLSAQIKNLPRWAFQGCTNLKKVTWDEGYEPTVMGYRAFWGSGIEEFTVPSSAKTIQKEAFDNCPSLKKLVFNRSLATTVYSNAYGVTNPNADLKVYISWRQARNWCDSVAQWSYNPKKYLNAWVSFGDFAYQDFSCYLPVKISGDNLQAYGARLVDDEGRTNYQVSGDKLYVKREQATSISPQNGYLLHGTPNTKYFLDRDLSYSIETDNYLGIIRPQHVTSRLPDMIDGHRIYSLPVGSEGEFVNAGGNVRGGGAYIALDNDVWSNIRYVDIVDSLGLRGDLNGDGQVDVTDVSIAIDIVLGKAAFNAAADLDGNGSVDVTDVSILIDIVLGK